MFKLPSPYVHLKGVLTIEDLRFLKDACLKNLRQKAMPCFALIDQLESPTLQKIKGHVEEVVGNTVHYLNDFYMYTDQSSRAGWHMDTELITFETAVNAWILLSPELIKSPLGFIGRINETPQRLYHSVEIHGDRCTFGNYCTGETEELSLKELEQGSIAAPEICCGDILLFNPKLFHKTNTDVAKHGFAIKFIVRGKSGFLSHQQVDPFLWPEVETFNKLVGASTDWTHVIQEIRSALGTPDGKRDLSSGFYPKRFDLYSKMVESL